MYNTTEIFADSNVAFDLTEVLKSCFFSYYKKVKNDLQNDEINSKMEQTEDEILSKEKGE